MLEFPHFSSIWGKCYPIFPVNVRTMKSFYEHFQIFRIPSTTGSVGDYQLSICRRIKFGSRGNPTENLTLNLIYHRKSIFNNFHHSMFRVQTNQYININWQ